MGTHKLTPQILHSGKNGHDKIPLGTVQYLWPGVEILVFRLFQK